MAGVPNIQWCGGTDGHLRLLDQTRLPSMAVLLDIRTVPELVDAIRRLAVRGAPAIGVAAGYGASLAAQGAASGRRERVAAAIADLRAARPTAVNLFFALDRQAAVLAAATEDDLPERLLDEARAIHEQDTALCSAIGMAGAELITDGMTLLTHCNTGRLATAGIGTALGVITTAAAQGKQLRVLANETRPLLQGARLTAFELAEAGIPCSLLSDSAGPGLIARGEIDAVLVGADRIAANGDTANKVGTLPLALAAKLFGVPFYVVAPTTTFDLALPDGKGIPIEERDGSEVLAGIGPGNAPAGIDARNPAFDVTPANLITALVTERGVLPDPTTAGIKDLVTPDR